MGLGLQHFRPESLCHRWRPRGSMQRVKYVLRCPPLSMYHSRRGKLRIPSDPSTTRTTSPLQRAQHYLVNAAPSCIRMSSARPIGIPLDSCAGMANGCALIRDILRLFMACTACQGEQVETYVSRFTPRPPPLVNCETALTRLLSVSPQLVTLGWEL